MTDLEDANRLLGEALEHNRQARITYIQKYKITPALTEQARCLKDVLALLENMEKGEVENYEIAYRQGWQAAKASSLEEPPAEEPKTGTKYEIRERGTNGKVQRGKWKRDTPAEEPNHAFGALSLCKIQERLAKEKASKEPKEEKKHLHAGLEDGTLNLIVFDDTEQLKKMLNIIGFLVDDEGIVTDKGEPVTCSGCGCKLTLDEIGHVMPPDHFYCSSPVCIMDYYERYGHLEKKEEE